MGASWRIRTAAVALACAPVLGWAAATVEPTPATPATVRQPDAPGTTSPGVPAGATTSPEQAARPVRASTDLLVTGNTFWGRYVEDWADASGLGTRWPFSRLGELHRERYDAWVTGLECPTVPGLDVGSAEQERLLRFNCEPRFLAEAARWFTAVTLANNHTDNQGRTGLAETRRLLTRHGIQYVGDPDPTRLDRVCEVIGFRADVVRDDGTRRRGTLPVALCGFHGVFEVPPAAALREMERYARHLPVLALPHSGLEYVPGPDQIKVDLYRDLVDHGADAVLGDHAHWVQTSEAWRGRPIVYSMGNFLFDQQGDAEVTRSAAIRVRISTGDPHLAQWLRLGQACTAPDDDCLARIRRTGLPELRAVFGFGVVGTSNLGRLTHVADPAATRLIRQRLDWAATMAALRPPYRPLRPTAAR